MSSQKIVLLCFVLFCSTLLCEAGKGQKFLSVESDPCNQWPNCTSCLSNKYCGWCSTPVKYYDNSPGFQCAGFNPDNSSDPFICYGTYSTDKCAVGYNCSDTEQKCILAQPGDGVPEDQCSSSCYPKTFSCSPTNVSCVPTPASQGGIPLTVCQAQCTANNNTPTDVIGIWRGLQISSEYTSGEWKLVVTTSNASLYYPSGNLYYSGSVSQVQSYLVITITSGSLAGKKVYAFYQTQIGPVTTFLTIATNNPNKGDFSPPVSFDSAMTGGEEFIFEACLDARYCNFDITTLSARYSKFKEMQLDPPVDHCSVFANCTSCLDSPFCGWCSSRVIYQGNVLGANCAGFNQNQTDNPFECVGTYSTQKCPLPPPIYKCDSNSSQCVLSQTGGSSLSVCNATCGRNNSQIFYKCNVAKLTCEPDQSGQDQATCNSTCQIRPMPVELNGVWRGIEVSENYLKGEWGMVVSSYDNFDSNFTLTSPNNITLSGSFQHVASEAVLIVQFTYPVGATRYALYELADGPETSYLTLAFGAFGSDTYPSFIEAMTGDGMSELTFISCLNPTICKFIPLDLDL